MPGKSEGGNMTKGFLMLLKPADDKCQECGVAHFPEQPHNKDSMYYQIKFEMEHWKEELILRGVWEKQKGVGDDL
jgi:hypothetical protein